MSPDEIGRSYDQIAENWRSPHLQTNGIAPFEKAIAFCRNRGTALDIGCGSSGRFFDLLQRHGFKVEGIDVSERMVTLARERNPGVSIHRADVTTWEFPRRYDFIAGWDSIWHVPAAGQEPMMRRICRALAPGGVFIFTTGGLDEPADKTDTAMGPPVHYGVLGIPRTLSLFDECGCMIRHLEFDQWPESHLVIIAQRS